MDSSLPEALAWSGVYLVPEPQKIQLPNGWRLSSPGPHPTLALA